MQRLAVLVLALLTLAGCSSPERSPSLPPLSPASPASQPSGSLTAEGDVGRSSTAHAVVRPPEADRSDEAGAAAFARYWFDELNAAYITVDPSRLISISEPACVTCQAYIASLRRAAAAGEYYSGGQAVTRDAVTAPFDGGVPMVLVDVSTTPLMVYSSDGALKTTVPGETNATVQVELARHGSTWLAHEIAQA